MPFAAFQPGCRRRAPLCEHGAELTKVVQPLTLSRGCRCGLTVRVAVHGSWTSPGLAGIAGYIYLTQFSTKSTATPAAGASKSYTPATNTTSPLDPSKFIDLPLKSVEPYNHNCAIYSFGLPEGQAALLPVASCVYLEASENHANALRDDKGKPVHRPYTPISPNDYPGEVQFLIKRYDGGKMSQYIHSLKPGEPIAIKGPLPKIKYESESCSGYSFVRAVDAAACSQQVG